MISLEEEKRIKEVSNPITRPISVGSLISLLTIFSSPIVWIWMDWEHAWKTGLTGILALIVFQYLIYCVNMVFRQSYDQEVEIAKKGEALDEYESKVKKSRFQKKMEEIARKKMGR